MLTLVWPPFGHFLFKPHLGKIQEGSNKTKKQLTINTLCCFQYAFMWTLIILWTHQASRLVSVHVHAEITYIILLRIEPATFQLLDNPLYFPRNSKINPVLCIWPHVLIYIKTSVLYYNSPEKQYCDAWSILDNLLHMQPHIWQLLCPQVIRSCGWWSETFYLHEETNFFMSLKNGG